MSSPNARIEEFASIGTTADIKANELLLQGIEAAEEAREEKRRKDQVEDGLQTPSRSTTVDGKKVKESPYTPTEKRDLTKDDAEGEESDDDMKKQHAGPTETAGSKELSEEEGEPVVVLTSRHHLTLLQKLLPIRARSSGSLSSRESICQME